MTMPNGVNGIQYRLKLSDPLWIQWQIVRTELADTLMRFGPDHRIEISYDPDDMLQQARIRKSVEKKKSLFAATQQAPG